MEEPNRLILFRMLPGRRAASELVFSLRGSHSRSRSRSRGSKRQRECFGSTRVTDGCHPLFKYREHPRPAAGRAPENTFREHDNGRQRLYSSAENNISVRSRRNGRFFAGSLTNDDATNPPCPVQKGGRHLSP